MSDFMVRNEGTVWVFAPQTAESRVFVKTELALEPWQQWAGSMFAVEHRYAPALCNMLQDEGFVLTGQTKEANMTMLTPKFPMGQIVATPGAIEAMEGAGQTADFFLDQHASGNWGVVDAEDWQLNDQAVVDGSRLLSAYKTLKGVKLWVITEATDDNGHRAATTLLLPDEY